MQTLDCPFGKVVDDIRMGLEHAYVVANFFGYLEKFICPVDIGGDTEVGALNGDEAEEIGCEAGNGRVFSARGEREGEGRMRF